MRCYLTFAILIALATSASAQQQLRPLVSPNGPQLGEARTRYIQFGIEITAKGGPVHNLIGTVPVPVDWPEQQIRVVDEKTDDEITKVTYRMLNDTVKQMRVELARLGAGKTARVLVTYEVRRHLMTAPKKTDGLRIPEKPSRELRMYLGPSPFIDSTHSKIRKLAKEIIEGKEGDWQKVEAIYDWVRDNIKYINGPIKSSYQALKDKNGDCEELTSLFIAMCRASKIPARMVWVPGHCYPEFYLQDEGGQGYWFPCQAAGNEAFGEMPESRPVLQKGDNFRHPTQKRKRMRYMAEILQADDGVPQLHPVRELLGEVR